MFSVKVSRSHLTFRRARLHLTFCGLIKENLIEMMSGFERNRISIKETVATYGRHAGDHGSAVAQVAILTTRIRYLTAHLQKHKKDKNTLRALQVRKRRRRKRGEDREEHPVYSVVGVL